MENSHTKGRHLVIGNLACRVTFDEEGDLRFDERKPVTFFEDELGNIHGEAVGVKACVEYLQGLSPSRRSACLYRGALLLSAPKDLNLLFLRERSVAVERLSVVLGL